MSDINKKKRYIVSFTHLSLLQFLFSLSEETKKKKKKKKKKKRETNKFYKKRSLFFGIYL